VVSCALLPPPLFRVFFFEASFFSARLLHHLAMVGLPSPAPSPQPIFCAFQPLVSVSAGLRDCVGVVIFVAHPRRSPKRRHSRRRKGGRNVGRSFGLGFFFCFVHSPVLQVSLYPLPHRYSKPCVLWSLFLFAAQFDTPWSLPCTSSHHTVALRGNAVLAAALFVWFVSLANFPPPPPPVLSFSFFPSFLPSFAALAVC
jgi:hypothetical protein